jgi:hypothetical protein
VREEKATFSGLWVTMMIVWPSSLRDLNSSISSFRIFESEFPELTKSNFLELNLFLVVFNTKTHTPHPIPLPLRGEGKNLGKKGGLP